MANALKKAVFNLMDKAFTQQGFVLKIRKWEPASIYEIDLYMPETDMDKWDTIPRIKCKVAEYEYRDYTPAVWNADEKVCTVIIDAGHPGWGSSWVQNLREGDIVLFAPAHAARLPAKPGKIICFGDGSAVGHFLALKQLTNRDEYPLEAVIFLSEQCAIPDFFIDNNPEFEFVIKPHGNSLNELQRSSENKALPDYTSIYLAGHIPMVTGLRKIFKNIPYLTARIVAHGFWS